ncbi:MAG: hypothetical protein ACI8X5_000379 [Planctomycetota bacterium]|jgi:uncharacterized protein (DUF58 family)
MSGAARTLPAAKVRFASDFGARLAALELHLAHGRQSPEGAGSAAKIGMGTDFAGYRPYRAGEDLRQLDWNLLARLDQPFVKVTRREAGENWVVCLDSSASMGVGPPGKLQRAAECSAALCALGARFGARVKLLLSPGAEDRPRVFEAGARDGQAALLEFLEEQEAAGSSGLASLLNHGHWFREASRVFCIGDLCDTPASLVLSLRRASRDISLLHLCAPDELDPPLGAIKLWDAENQEVLALELTEAKRSQYRAAVEERLELWRTMASRHRIGYVCRSTDEDFEPIVSLLFAR